MLDRGFFITREAIGRQLAAIPNDLYLVRLIHHATRRAFPGERLWTADQLMRTATIRFLRLRNREGCDVYIHPYADDQNPGYVLLDLDLAHPRILETMRHHRLDPCLVVRTSPGHVQAWVHLSRQPLEPALATAAAKQLAQTYGGDRASADWRHLGRLAGFTNQKPARRAPTGYSPWVTIVHARHGLAPGAQALLHQAHLSLTSPTPPHYAPRPAPPPLAAIDPGHAIDIYQHWVQQWRITKRFPQPDWSIVDLWVARKLLGQGQPLTEVEAILQHGSPGFPRSHGNPQDYLRRTLARAAFSHDSSPVCLSTCHS